MSRGKSQCSHMTSIDKSEISPKALHQGNIGASTLFYGDVTDADTNNMKAVI